MHPARLLGGGIAGDGRCLASTARLSLWQHSHEPRDLSLGFCARALALSPQSRVLAAGGHPGALARAVAGHRQLPDAAEPVRPPDVERLRRHPGLRAAGRADRGRDRHLVHGNRLGGPVRRPDHRHPLRPGLVRLVRPRRRGRCPVRPHQRNLHHEAAHLVDHRLDRDAEYLLWPADRCHRRQVHHIVAEVLPRRDMRGSSTTTPAACHMH